MAVGEGQQEAMEAVAECLKPVPSAAPLLRLATSANCVWWMESQLHSELHSQLHSELPKQGGVGHLFLKSEAFPANRPAGHRDRLVATKKFQQIARPEVTYYR